MPPSAGRPWESHQWGQIHEQLGTVIGLALQNFGEREDSACITQRVLCKQNVEAFVPRSETFFDGKAIHRSQERSRCHRGGEPTPQLRQLLQLDATARMRDIRAVIKCRATKYEIKSG